MVASFASFLSLLTRILKSRKMLGIPPPAVKHKVLEKDVINSYDEVFVIGDVHGCYYELKKLLRKADVDHKHALKIFVGDLVNKGPYSEKVLSLIRSNESMLSVRGNHEERAICEYYRYQYYDWFLSPEGHWIADLPRKYIYFMENFPYTISLPHLNAVIVHAGLFPGISVQKNLEQDMVNMRNIIVQEGSWTQNLHATTKSDKGVPWAAFWKGPDHVYFGHDAKKRLQIWNYATGLDTGCVYGNKLTGIFIYGPRKGEFVSVDALDAYA